MNNCPLPDSRFASIQLAHGGGGALSRALLEELILPAFDNPALARRHDGAVLERPAGPLAFTTDSYVVRPLFFPGGDIGHLAVCGTVNDLAMCGARPRHLSVGLILEEGLPMADLRRVIESMAATAAAAGVQLVTGDTKVVDRGKGDGIFINTAGIGVIGPHPVIAADQVTPGDAVILTGDIGRHGVAILTAREELGLDPPVESDCALLHEPVLALLEAGIPIHCLRDLTRGGLATALKEIARDSGWSIRLREHDIPVHESVRGACELLGLDPLYVANEGRMIVILPAAETGRALELLQAHPVSAGSRQIGEVRDRRDGRLTLESAIGATRVLDLLSGEQLPRIC
jgi:hydrogenase expression/formation protein HypE